MEPPLVISQIYRDNVHRTYENLFIIYNRLDDAFQIYCDQLCPFRTEATLIQCCALIHVR